MKVLIFIVVAFLATSCSFFKSNDEIISKEKFADVLADMHFADAVLVEKGYRIVVDSSTIELFYSDVLKKNQITAAQLNSAIQYYTKHSEEYDKVYDLVLEIMAKRSSEAKEAEKNILPKEKVDKSE